MQAWRSSICLRICTPQLSFSSPRAANWGGGLPSRLTLQRSPAPQSALVVRLVFGRDIPTRTGCRFRLFKSGDQGKLRVPCKLGPGSRPACLLPARLATARPDGRRAVGKNGARYAGLAVPQYVYRVFSAVSATKRHEPHSNRPLCTLRRRRSKCAGLGFTQRHSGLIFALCSCTQSRSEPHPPLQHAPSGTLPENGLLQGAGSPAAARSMRGRSVGSNWILIFSKPAAGAPPPGRPFSSRRILGHSSPYTTHVLVQSGFDARQPAAGVHRPRPLPLRLPPPLTDAPDHSLPLRPPSAVSARELQAKKTVTYANLYDAVTKAKLVTLRAAIDVSQGRQVGRRAVWSDPPAALAALALAHRPGAEGRSHTHKLQPCASRLKHNFICRRRA